MIRRPLLACRRTGLRMTPMDTPCIIGTEMTNSARFLVLAVIGLGGLSCGAETQRLTGSRETFSVTAPQARAGASGSLWISGDPHAWRYGFGVIMEVSLPEGSSCRRKDAEVRLNWKEDEVFAGGLAQFKDSGGRCRATSVTVLGSAGNWPCPRGRKLCFRVTFRTDGLTYSTCRRFSVENLEHPDWCSDET